MINLKKILLLTLIIILIPLLIVGLTNSTNLLYKIKYGSINNKVIKVKRNESNLVESIPIEKYVVGVVAGEMPASFNEEALKAQAVASRTYALNKAQNSKNDYDVDDGTSSQVYIDEERLADLMDQMRTQCEAMGALFDERSLDCVFTVEFYAGDDSTLYASKKAYAGSTFSCTPDWFGIDITTFMQEELGAFGMYKHSLRLVFNDESYTQSLQNLTFKDQTEEKSVNLQLTFKVYESY